MLALLADAGGGAGRGERGLRSSHVATGGEVDDRRREVGDPAGFRRRPVLEAWDDGVRLPGGHRRLEVVVVLLLTGRRVAALVVGRVGPLQRVKHVLASR